MILGEMIMPGETVYTPPMSRGGSQAVFAYNVLKIAGGTLTVTVENKNYGEELDSEWVANGAADTATAAGVNNVDRSELKEQVRLKLTMTTGGTDWARVFIYNPTWES